MYNFIIRIIYEVTFTLLYFYIYVKVYFLNFFGLIVDLELVANTGDRKPNVHC